MDVATTTKHQTRILDEFDALNDELLSHRKGITQIMCRLRKLKARMVVQSPPQSRRVTVMGTKRNKNHHNEGTPDGETMFNDFNDRDDDGDDDDTPRSPVSSSPVSSSPVSLSLTAVTASTNAPTTPPRTSRGGGLNKPFPLSDSLCAFMSKPAGTEMARTEVTKYLHAYINQHKLKQGQYIVPNTDLCKLFALDENEEKIHFLHMQRRMTPHFKYHNTTATHTAAANSLPTTDAHVRDTLSSHKRDDTAK